MLSKPFLVQLILRDSIDPFPSGFDKILWMAFIVVSRFFGGGVPFRLPAQTNRVL